MAQNELRKASIVDSNFQEIALRAQKKFKLAYLETTLLLYKRLNNNYSIELIEEEIKKTNESDDLLVKEKKPSINKQIQKKLDIINQFENNDNSDVKNTPSNTSTSSCTIGWKLSSAAIAITPEVYVSVSPSLDLLWQADTRISITAKPKS